MARKKRDTGGGGGSAPWMNTFADLMNLLLCFFVLLFSFSTIDAKKFEELSISMANSIGILEGGEEAIGKEGQLINSGMSQLSEISEYFTTMGTNSRMQEQENIENEGVYDPKDPIGTGNDKSDTSSSEGSGSAQGEIELEEAIEKIEKEMAETSTQMFDEISDLTDKSNLGEYLELDLDPNYQYVQLTLKGSVLYDSGKADIKKEAEPILKKLGDIIKNFEEHTVEITGHTDNVPISNSAYRDNNWLSSARALNAADFLIKECKISPDKLKYSGRGEYEPISSNATPEGRAKNRRIEIKIYNKLSSK